MKFGHSCRSVFTLSPSYTNLNNGSFGSCPSQVYNYKLELQKQLLENSDYFVETLQEKLIKHSKQLASEFIGASTEQTVFTQNSSDAFNAVLKSFNFKQGDNLVLSNITYRSNARVYDYLQEKYKVNLLTVKFDRNSLQNQEGILNTYESFFKRTEENIKFVSLDHISSQPAILFPVKEIINIIRKYQPSALIFVDGAHAVGQTPISISDISPDFYCTNYHKWGFAPKSVCLLWVNEKYLNQVRPNIIGIYYQEGFQRAFYWQGTQDQTSYIAVSQAIKFWKDVGQENIRNYCHKLAVEGGKRVAQIWNTDLLTNDESLIPNMVMVRIPNDDQKTLKPILEIILNKYNISLAGGLFDGQTYVRFSAQVFNEISDFERAANIFLQVQKDVQQLKPKL